VAAGWGNVSVHRVHQVEIARLNEELVKRGLKITALEQQLGRIHLVLGKDWRGRYAQDLAAELLIDAQEGT